MVKVGGPKDNTPGCTQEACDFRDLSPALPLELQGQVLLPFTLVAGPEKEIVNKYGHAGAVLESL